LRLSGSPTQLPIKATHRRVRSKRVLGGVVRTPFPYEIRLPQLPQFTVHNANDETSLTKIRPPEIVGWAQVALSATL